MKNNTKKNQIKKSHDPQDTIELLQPENGNLINPTIIQILVEKDHPDEIKDLMQAELDYNREKLSILREHAELHPDAIEERKTKAFRRTQYTFLMVVLLMITGIVYIAPLSVSIAFSAIAMMITAGIVINGRDRDNDSEALITLLNKLIKASK